MTREQILEERCERFKKLLLRDIPEDKIADVTYDWCILGKITYNDARYLAGLTELDDAEIAYNEKSFRMTKFIDGTRKILDPERIRED